MRVYTYTCVYIYIYIHIRIIYLHALYTHTVELTAACRLARALLDFDLT